MKLVNYLKTSNVYVEHTTTSYIKLMHVTFALTDKKIKSKNWKICLKLGFKSYKWTTKNKLWTVFWGCWKKPFFKEKKMIKKMNVIQKLEMFMIPIWYVAVHLIYRTLCSDLKKIFFFFLGGLGLIGGGMEGIRLTYE